MSTYFSVLRLSFFYQIYFINFPALFSTFHVNVSVFPVKEVMPYVKEDKSQTSQKTVIYVKRLKFINTLFPLRGSEHKLVYYLFSIFHQIFSCSLFSKRAAYACFDWMVFWYCYTFPNASYYQYVIILCFKKYLIIYEISCQQ